MSKNVVKINIQKQFRKLYNKTLKRFKFKIM